MNENEKSNAREPFFLVPSRVFDEGLNPYELAVLFYLIMRSDNEKHTCFPSEKGIAKACGMSLSTVKRTVKSLDEKKLIHIQKQFSQSKNGLNRQTSNLYTIQFCRTPPTVQSDTRPSSDRHSPQLTQTREINKTKPNITKTNITISTELSVDEAMDLEKERFSFLELKRECFEILKNERGLEEEYVLLLDRALEHLYFKNGAEYEGRKYTQNELRGLLASKTNPDILLACVEFLSASKEPVRSPVAYLGKCILGGLVNGISSSKSANSDVPDAPQKRPENPDGMNGNPSFDVDDFFTAAMKNMYGDNFKI